jgi:AcrR family transcriptional regulator
MMIGQMTEPDTRSAPQASRRGRADQAILEATRAMLTEVGVRAMTIEGVAARSGVAKTTIYRRWRDKNELALAAVWNDLAQASLQAPADLGATGSELLAFVQPVITTMRSPLMSGVIRGLISEIATNHELGRAYREQFIEPRLAQLERVIAGGVERGDLRPDTNVRLAHELLVGPVFYRLLFSGQPLDEGLGTRVADAVLRAFAAD